MYNFKHLKTKKIICSFILAFAMLLSAFSGVHIGLFDAKTVSASTSSYLYDEISESIFEKDSSEANYYSFATSSSTKPATANGWSKMETEATNYDNIKHGIVNVKEADDGAWGTDEEKTYRTTRPTVFEQNKNDTYYKNLMINSYNGAGALGYKSNSISLEADSYYNISVTLYTHRTDSTDPRASIYITGLVEDTDENKDTLEQLKFEDINTLTGIKTYTFYIATDSSADINIELWLGSKTSTTQGAVFFNNVSVTRCSEAYYNAYYVDNLEDTEDDTHNFITLSKDKVAPFSNSSFEDFAFTDWKSIEQPTSKDQICQPVDVTNYSHPNSKISIEAPGSNCSKDNEYALLMYNDTSSYQGVESPAFTVEHHKYYRLSFWSKSNCNTGDGATVYLVDKTENSTIENASLTLATTYTAGSNKFRNDWTNYNFYIYGPVSDTKEITVQIWLGTEESKTTGYVFVDDFKLEEITYEKYSSGTSTTSTNSAFNLNEVNSSLTITNGSFDVTENADDKAQFPLTPANWKRSGDENNTFSGVINTKDWDNHVDNFHSSGYTPTNPGVLPYMEGYRDYNNALMIGSESETNSQTYYISDLTITSGQYYLFSFYVFTDYNRNISGKDYGASFKLSTTDQTILDYKNIYFNDNKWHLFEFYIDNSNSASDLSTTLSLNFDGLGYVFFDDVMMVELDEDSYPTMSGQQTPGVETLAIDLSKETFDNRTYNSNETTQTPNNWKAEEESNIEVNKSGILSTDDPAIRNLDPTLSCNKNILYISSTHDVYYSFVSKETFSFTGNSYYKISVNILTRNIAQDQPEDDIIYGASFGIVEDSNVIFKSITTNGQWKTYTIYFCPETDTQSAVRLSLGASEEATSGDVLFDNLSIETIEEADYLSGIGSTEDEYFKAFINYSAPEEEDEEETDDWENNFNWLILPSLLTGLALVIAIVGYYVRKINFTRKPKVKTKYDRRKTLDKDIDRREQIALRKQIIAELNEELIAIDKEIEEYKLLASQKFDVIKERILAEQERIKQQKLEIEIKKKEAKAEREKELKSNPELISNTKAEKDFVNYISKLDKQELALQKQLNIQSMKLANAEQPDNIKLDSFLERKEYIKNEIAKIEAEILEISKEEEAMWNEYKVAKAEAKKQRAEYKEQQKQAKSSTKGKKEDNEVKAEDNADSDKNETETTDTSKNEETKTEENVEIITPADKDNK